MTNRRIRLLTTSATVMAVTMIGAVDSATGAPSGSSRVQVVDETADAVSQFYRIRLEQPLWLGEDSGEAAQQLLNLLGTGEVDGISKGKFDVGSLLVAVREASSGDRRAVKKADLMLSKAFVTFAQAIQRDPKVGVIYVDPELKPGPSSAADLLRRAANVSSLEDYIREIRWMNPLYGQLRQALVRRSYATPQERHVLTLNLERARALPPAKGKYVLVNTANQRLSMYENGEIVDEMKVIAGRSDAQTPLMNGYIRFAVLNPYWNVPTDLTARLAPNVIKGGKTYLDKQGYQVVADFSDDPQVLNPQNVDWDAVAAGKQSVQLRQRPGPANSMGRIKFMFPNSQGVWLHDTPDKSLFESAVRLESAGCVRLEDAWRLGSWLFQRPLQLTAKEPELQLELPEPVPIYITYLTAIPRELSVSYLDDPYRRDPPPYTAGVADEDFRTAGETAGELQLRTPAS